MCKKLVVLFCIAASLVFMFSTHAKNVEHKEVWTIKNGIEYRLVCAEGNKFVLYRKEIYQAGYIGDC